MIRIFIAMSVMISLAVIDTSHGASGTFSGRIWNDLNRDGIQDPEEPGMSNFPILVYNENLWWCNGCVVVKTNFTDASGNYEFSHAKTTNICNYPLICDPTPDNNFYISFTLGVLGIKSSNVVNVEGATLDWNANIYVTNENVVITNHDVGLFYRDYGLSLEVSVNNAHAGTPYYVTNGAEVTYMYRVVNTGVTFLSLLTVSDDTYQEFFGYIDCPATIYSGQTVLFTNQVVINESVTNHGFVSAFPVDPLFCHILYSYQPVQNSSEFIVIVVTNLLTHDDGDVFPSWWEIQYGFDPLNSNSPSVNSDSDWMNNYEEFISGTDPTNSASFFPNVGLSEENELLVNPSVTDRVYNIWRSTNLLGEPQEWFLVPPEQTGTGASIYFTVPGDDPAAQFRTGVRLP